MISIKSKIVIEGLEIDPDEIYIVKTKSNNHYIGQISNYSATNQTLTFDRVFVSPLDAFYFNYEIYQDGITSVEKFKDMEF